MIESGIDKDSIIKKTDSEAIEIMYNDLGIKNRRIIMKKRLISAILTISMIAALTGCGGNTGAESIKSDGSQNEAVQEESGSDSDAGNTAESDLASEPEPATSESALTETEADEEPAGAPEIVLLKKHYYENSDDEEYKELFTGSFATPLLSEKSAKAYPELARSMEEDGKTELEYFESQVDEYLTQARTDYTENTEYFYGPYTINQQVTVKRLDDKVASFFFPVDAFMGGAHGIYGNGYTTYDTPTGKVLKLVNVVNSVNDLPGILKTELEKTYADSLDMFFDLEGSLANYVDGDSFSEGDNYYTGYTWAFTDEGIEFYFGPYELAAYAAGAQTVVLKYNEYADFIKPEYIPDSTADKKGRIIEDINMPGVDIDQDGNPDSLYVEYGTDANGDVSSADIVYNDQRLTVANEGDIPDLSEVKCYLVETADDRCYAYVVTSEYSDYIGIHVYDLNSGTLKKNGEKYLSRAIIGYDDDDYSLYREYAFYDPDKMYFAERFDIIASFSAIMSYHVGADGIPEPDSDVYEIGTVAGWEPITCIKDFDADFVNDDGTLTQGTVNTGETFELVRTDGKTWLDARISDGRIVRLSFNGGGIELTVNGINARELFKELMYAG